MANPPFHDPSAAAGPDPGRDRALREGEATLADWIDAGLRRLVPGGTLVLVHRPDRLAAILAALAGRAGAVELLPVGRAQTPPRPASCSAQPRAAAAPSASGLP